MIIIFNDNLIFKNKEIPRIILGSAPFTSESYFGHRSRLYHLDLEINSDNVAKIIKKANENGVNAINLVNNDNLIESYEKVIENKEITVIGTIGKSKIDYVNPNYEKAKNVNWKEDINLLSKYNCPIMLIDEFITDNYDFELIEKILKEIKSKGSFAGLITAYPFRTTEKLLKSPILDLFDFYMVPINKLGYMMDTKVFMDKERDNLANLLKKIDKKIIVNKILACGIQQVEEAFNFLKKLDYVDMVTIGVASEKEAEIDFKLLKDI
ncbi:hypothetical protein SDC9_03534 [bioreactor metagenome]|uniref:Uncharacterized protein n=1 Tax=bioreactor metagenome TaxID=1076179 RepID=A0A644STK0_9ZZZZ|nr:hypothetical protein [Methanobrevibacter sp.]MEA4956153.1 hypothetical protein [Methanobrevibacter sp.]